MALRLTAVRIPSLRFAQIFCMRNIGSDTLLLSNISTELVLLLEIFYFLNLQYQYY
jgi:hypothetical protein